MNHKHMFNAAREVSYDADYCGSSNVRIGCVVAYKGTILAKGSNSNKTHPTQDRYNIYRYKNVGNGYLPAKVHSEIAALNKIKYLDIDFSQVHVYVYRETKNGKYAMARPCPACRKYIQSLGIKKIHYTTDCGFAHEEIANK